VGEADEALDLLGLGQGVELALGLDQLGEVGVGEERPDLDLGHALGTGGARGAHARGEPAREAQAGRGTGEAGDGRAHEGNVAEEKWQDKN
jgi:hypothetical protein